jgi:hypothetical protein
MKKLLFLFAFCLLTVSCEKWPDLLIPGSEVPRWLKERISKDEKKIKSDPQSGLDVAAWIRYNFRGDYYFEYRNGFSSLGPEIFNFKCTKIMLNQEPYLNFEAEKCCREFVWKGPHYIDY